MKTFTIGMILSQLATFAWAGTLMDNFDDGNFEGWRLWELGDQTAEWSVKNGELVCVSKNNCSWASIMIIGDDSWASYKIEVQFKLVKTFPPGCVRSPAIGISVRDSDVKRDLAVIGVYTQGIGPNWDKVICQFFTNGNAQNFNDGAFTTQADKWYTMRLAVDGNHYEAFIDGKQICRFQTNLLEKGAAGLLAADCEVHFDNVIVTGDDIPDKNLGLSVDSTAKLATTWGQVKDF